MKQKMKKSVLCYVTAIFCLTMLFGVTVQAASKNPKDYFFVSVATYGNAGMVNQSASVKNFDITIGNWGQAVSTGENIGASIYQKSGVGSISSLPAVDSYTWKLVDESGTYTRTLYGQFISIPARFSGGHLEVTVKTEQDDIWLASEFGSYVSII